MALNSVEFPPKDIITIINICHLFFYFAPQLWKKHYAVDGQISQHLSPFEQNIISPMFKDAYSKIYTKLKDVAMEAGPGLGLGIAVYFWAEYDYKRRAFEHRD